MSRPSVTVIIVNWNGGDMLIECLSRIITQSLAPVQILVMDNASTDGSAQRAAKIPGVDVHFSDQNIGFAAANNRGIKASTADFVALINPDAFAEPDWLKCLVDKAILHPDVAALGSCQLVHGNDGVIDGTGDVYHWSGLVWRRGHGRPISELNTEQSEIFAPCAAAALYRRSALIQVGGFDEDFFCYMEDVDLGFRLRLAGYRSVYVPEAMVYHVGSALTGGQQSNFSVYHGHRNLVWTFVKNMPPILFWTLTPLHLALNIVSLAYFTLRGQGRIVFGAKRDALKGLANAWSKRSVIQSHRVASTSDIWKTLDKRLFKWKI